uniref:SCP domain-containing protein n=1 Tax=Strongyloides venezuelensis TaxID=75913 RepID=A0A0K0G207_STRVS
MIFNHLLGYIIFIILSSKNGVLSDGGRKSVRFAEEPEIKSFKEYDPADRINHPSRMIFWGENKIKTFYPEQPPNMLRRVNSDLGDYRRGKYLFEDPIISKLGQYIEKLSISGKIWRHVWKHCPVYSSVSSKKFILLEKNFCTEINLYRKLHGSMPLKLDPYLSTQALEVAKQFARIGKSSFRKNNSGVNCKKIHFTLAPLVVNTWYKECRNYNYKHPGLQPLASHFIDLIWRGSVKLGIGIVKSDPYLCICFIFSPSIKVQNKFSENVGKAKYHFINSRSFFMT